MKVNLYETLFFTSFGLIYEQRFDLVDDYNGSGSTIDKIGSSGSVFSRLPGK